MKVSLVTPQKLLAEQEAKHVILPGTEGDFGVLPGHMALVSTLRENAEMVIDGTDGSKTTFIINGGFAEVGKDGVTVLAEQAEAK